jgi:hypothetical protein
LARWHSPLDYVLGDARLRDLKSQFEQLAVNAWRAPKWVLDSHPPDQRAQLRLDWRPPRLLEPIGNIPPAEAEQRYYAMLEQPAMAA